MTISAGQALALRQLRSIELASPQALEILDVIEPIADGALMWVNFSLDCKGVAHAPSGIQLRERERISIGIDPGFPFDVPYTGSPRSLGRKPARSVAAPALPLPSVNR